MGVSVDHFLALMECISIIKLQFNFAINLVSLRHIGFNEKAVKKWKMIFEFDFRWKVSQQVVLMRKVKVGYRDIFSLMNRNSLPTCITTIIHFNDNSSFFQHFTIPEMETSNKSISLVVSRFVKQLIHSQNDVFHAHWTSELSGSIQS